MRANAPGAADYESQPITKLDDLILGERERDVPDEARPPLARCPEFETATEALGPGTHVAQATPVGACPAHAPSIVDDNQAQVVTRRHGDCDM